MEQQNQIASMVAKKWQPMSNHRMTRKMALTSSGGHVSKAKPQHTANRIPNSNQILKA